MTALPSHTHDSPSLSAAAVQWPHDTTDPDRITLARGDWTVRLIVRAPVADVDEPDVLRRLVEYALAELDRAGRGMDSHLDDSAA